MVIIVVTMMLVSCGATDTGRRHSRCSANVWMLEGRHSVVRCRFRSFIPSTTHGMMRRWLTPENHANRIRRAATGTRAPIRLTPVLSVLRRQRTRSARHLTFSVLAELRSTQRSNEVTSMRQVRHEDVVLCCRPRLVSDTAQAPERSAGGPRWSRAWCIQKFRAKLRQRLHRF